MKAAAYMTAFPLLTVWGYAHAPVFNATELLCTYDVLTSLIVALLCVADTALYRFWQFKIEASVLAYLHSLRGAFASVSVCYVVVAFVSVLMTAIVLLTFLLSVLWLLPPTKHPLPIVSWWGHLLIALVGILLAVALYCIIRGFHIRPDTPVYSYFSHRHLLNHCAVNPLYNFIYSIHLNDDFAHQFQVFDPLICEEKFGPLFPKAGKPQVQILNTMRPNILLIMWESLCAHFIESLGGKPNVMPHLDHLVKEGILFSNCWAGSFRTDRGLVCTLSGYPSPPTTSVILHTAKLPHLPALPRTLHEKACYETMAVHGGPLKIFHKADYYWASGHQLLVEQKDFPRDPDATRWGVQDGKVFAWLADDIINKSRNPSHWFTTLQTLSSHEPFHVPYNRIEDNEVDNAYAYVDEAFGLFIERLKASVAWKDLLIIVTGDHGLDTNRVPDKDRNSHIPLLLLGGAVSQPMRIETLMSQTDIAATLLGQMGLPHDEFLFSRDVLADTYIHPCALHTYNNGFIFRDPTGVTFYDNVSQKAIDGHDLQREEKAKVILQTLYTDFSKR